MPNPAAFRRVPPAFVLFTLTVLAGCAGASPAPGSAVPYLDNAEMAHRFKASGKIQHVVIIFQENRTFDNLFYGYPGADTATSGQNSKGQTIQLQPISLKQQYNLDHSALAMFEACNGPGSAFPGTQCQMNGFDREFSWGGPPNPEYVYVPQSESKPYFDMAHEGVLADRMFQSNLDESFVSHQYIIAAQAAAAVNLPTGAWGCDGGKTDRVPVLSQQRTIQALEEPCFDYMTLGDELDRAGLSWHFYTSQIAGDGGEWSGYQAVRHIRYSADWTSDVIVPQTQFITDIQGGFLANVTWITPTCANSDHAGCGGGTGPEWVGSLVNAIGESPFWNNTAIFIMWDDWGGLYDHVAPPDVGFDGLGFRVPLIIMSPYSKKNYVSHVQYETGSLLRFAEDQFGLKRLAASDARANSPQKDAFDFSKPPRAFVPIKTPAHDLNFYMHQPADKRRPDDE